MNELIQAMVDKIGNHNQGAELTTDVCDIHGETEMLDVRNEGGYKGTLICIECMSALIIYLGLRK